VAFHNLAGMIHENQVGDTNSTEVQAERVHPETVGPLGIARSDVAGDAFVEAELGEEAKGSGEALLAMTALFGGRGKNRWTRNALHESAVGWRSGGRGWLWHADLRKGCG